MAAGESGASGGLSPFSVALRREGNDTILTVAIAGHAAPGIRAASRANEVEVFTRDAAPAR